MFENFFGDKKGKPGGSGISQKPSPLEDAKKKISGAHPVIAGKTVMPGEGKLQPSPTVPGKPLAGKESLASPTAIAIKDCASPRLQEAKVMAMDARQAFEYLSGDNMDPLYVLISKMRPTLFVTLLEKLSKDNLKTVFEYLKKNDSFSLLQKLAEKDVSLVGQLVSIISKSGVNFKESGQANMDFTAEDLGLAESVGKAIEEKAKKEIERLRTELKQYGYDVTPEVGDGQETIADLKKLNSLIPEAELEVTKRDVEQKADKEAEKKVSYHDEFEEGGYKVVFDKKGEEIEASIADEIPILWAKMLVEFKAKVVFSKFREYLMEKYPERFPKPKESSFDKKGTDNGI